MLSTAVPVNYDLYVSIPFSILLGFDNIHHSSQCIVCRHPISGWLTMFSRLCFQQGEGPRRGLLRTVNTFVSSSSASASCALLPAPRPVKFNLCRVGKKRIRILSGVRSADINKTTKLGRGRVKSEEGFPANVCTIVFHILYCCWFYFMSLCFSMLYTCCHANLSTNHK